jgi:hypothetical protein
MALGMGILYGKANSLNIYLIKTLGLLWPKALLSVDSRNGFKLLEESSEPGWGFS